MALHGQDSHALIEVPDRGAGISVEDQPRVFDKFYRAPTKENELLPGDRLGIDS